MERVKVVNQRFHSLMSFLRDVRAGLPIDFLRQLRRANYLRQALNGGRIIALLKDFLTPSAIA